PKAPGRRPRRGPPRTAIEQPIAPFHSATRNQGIVRIFTRRVAHDVFLSDRTWLADASAGSRLSAANRCEDAPEVSSLPTGASLERSACRRETLQGFQPLHGGLLPQQPGVDAPPRQRPALLGRKRIEVRQ